MGNSNNRPYLYNNALLERNVQLRVVLTKFRLDITLDILSFELNFSIYGLSFGSFVLLDTDFNVFKNYVMMGGEEMAFEIISPISQSKIILKTVQINEIKIIPMNIDMGNNKNKFRVGFVFL